MLLEGKTSHQTTLSGQVITFLNSLSRLVYVSATRGRSGAVKTVSAT